MQVKRMNPSKNKWLWKITSLHSWKYRECCNCGIELIENDIIFSKYCNHKTKYYCLKCVKLVNLI